eukprot:UN08429
MCSKATRYSEKSIGEMWRTNKKIAPLPEENIEERRVSDVNFRLGSFVARMSTFAIFTEEVPLDSGKSINISNEHSGKSINISGGCKCCKRTCSWPRISFCGRDQDMPRDSIELSVKKIPAFSRITIINRQVDD